MKLCLNCLETYKLAGGLKIQHSTNSYRGTEHYTTTVQVCKPCGEAFSEGDMLTFHLRFRSERKVSRDG